MTAARRPVTSPAGRGVPVLELENVSKVYPGQPPVRALAGGEPGGGRRGAGRHRGPVGVGQVHAAAPDGHPGQADGRDGAHHRPGRGPDDRPGTVGAAGLPDRVRVPAVLPRRAPERARQRGRRAAVCRDPARPAAAAGRRRAGPGRARAPGRRPADPAVGRRAAAGRDRPGDRRPPAGGAGRRADREPRLRHRRRDPGPAGGAQRSRAPRSSSSPTTTRSPRGRGAASRCSTGASSPTRERP